jgi:ATP-binding protein involved in chromosome partitioning
LSLVDDARILLEASGKGGVGKSTTAIGMACALARRGLRVGLLDLDIRAPNITYLLGLPDRCDMAPSGEPVPLSHAGGFQVFSAAMLFRPGAAILMAGSALRSMVFDMLTTVAWGELDWLVVDMDPAPGDTLKAVRDAARRVYGVVVTTPDRTSVEDARRMIDSFAGLGIPPLGVVGNMVGLTCDRCGHTILNGAAIPEMRDVGRSTGVPELLDLPWDVQLHNDPVAAVTDRFRGAFDAAARRVVEGAP